MNETILLVASILSLVSLVLLVVRPWWGVLAIFVVRPLVDATWAQPLIGDYKLTELVSALVPVIIAARMVLEDGSRRQFRDMPLKWIWLIYTLDCVLFSSFVMFDEDWNTGLSILMRHMNGIVAFYMVQAYCHDERDFLKFAWALVIAGIFPLGTGFVEGITGIHWRITLAEDDVIRNIGFYHDGITIRYYALQSIMGVLLVHALGKRSFFKTLFCLLYGAAAVFVVKGAYSKSGVLTLASWMLMWPLLRKNYGTLAVLVGGMALSAVYFSREIMDSVGFIFTRELGAVQGNLQINETFAGRWFIWSDMLKSWGALPLLAQMFGAGQNANGAHNDYLQMLVSGGWVGLLIYVLLLLSIGWAIAKTLWVSRDVWSVSALLVFIMWIVDTIGLVPSAYSGYQWFVWGVIGFCLRYRQDERYRQVDRPVAVAPTPLFANLLGTV